MFSQKIKNKRRSIQYLFLITILIPLSLVTKNLNLQSYAQTITPPLPNATTAYPIYGLGATVLDQLHPNWTASTYLNDVNEYNPVNTNPVYSGQHSISWTAKGPWDELDLHAPSPIDITPYNYLSFYATATQVGQIYSVRLLDTSGKPMATELPFSQYGGVPEPGTWFVYNFPLNILAPGVTQIGGVAIHEFAGSAQPPVFLDDINLSRATAQQTTPTPQLNPTAVSTPLPTQPPFYYPDISPWVFIIPGIIIFIAVLFQ